jgi:putative ABC transport system ATP-binding protein
MESMQNDEPALQARDLVRTFGEGDETTVAVRNLTIDLYPGQISLLMGPSGSGKSTLLALLSGLMRPDTGEVITLGENLWRMGDREREYFRLRHYGFIFQGYNLFPALTARQQIEIVLRWGEGVNRRVAHKRTDEMLDLLGLTKKAHLRPMQLSGGEKQRVAIGRALVKNPDFCFADEPTSALDWAHGEQVVELLRSAAQERGATILVVSHDSRIVPFVDQVFHMEDGALLDAEAIAFNGRHGGPAAQLPSMH